jgi:hypothetical protein
VKFESRVTDTAAYELLYSFIGKSSAHMLPEPWHHMTQSEL